MYYKLEELKLW